MTELSECPCCEGDIIAVAPLERPSMPNGHQVCCGGCGVNGPELPGKQQAIEGWNAMPRRHQIMDMKWQPIETAPKDGTAIRAGRISLISIAGEPLYPLTSRFINGKWQGCFGDNRWAPYNPQPTHWVPLPEPPATPIPTGERR